MADETLNPFNFDREDLAPREIRGIKYLGNQYVLREATADVAMRFRTTILKGAKFEGGKPVSMGEGTAEAELILVAGCLFRVLTDPKTEEEKLSPLLPANIRSWPHRVVKPLFDKAREISDLNEGEDLPSLEKQLSELQNRVEEMRKDQSLKNASSSATMASFE